MGMFSGPAHGSAAWPRLNVASGQIGGRIAGDGPCASGRLRNGSRSLAHKLAQSLYVRYRSFRCTVPSGRTECTAHKASALFEFMGTYHSGQRREKDEARLKLRK